MIFNMLLSQGVQNFVSNSGQNFIFRVWRTCGAKSGVFRVLRKCDLNDNKLYIAMKFKIIRSQ